MSNDLQLYQYTCPKCDYMLYSKSNEENLTCNNKLCDFKENLYITNILGTKILESETQYTVKESFMVDHGCHEVRPIPKGTKVNVLRIKKDWYLAETMDGFHFYVAKEKLERLK